jgi:hypothetical protein
MGNAVYIEGDNVVVDDKKFKKWDDHIRLESKGDGFSGHILWSGKELYLFDAGRAFFDACLSKITGYANRLCTIGGTITEEKALMHREKS